MSFKSFFKRLKQPSSLTGVSILSTLFLVIPELLDKGRDVGEVAATGVEAGIQAGGAAAASGAPPSVIITAGVIAAATAALGIARDDKSDRQ